MSTSVAAGSAVAAPPAVGRRRVATLRRALKFRSMQLGVAMLALVIVFALVGPYLAPHSPTEFVGAPFAQPGAGHVLGTDQLGRDVLSRVMWGGRTILWMAVCSAILGVALGAALGLLAGYSRRLDNPIMRPLEVIQGFPAIVLILLFTALIGPKVWLILILVAAFNVPSVARVVRGMTVDVATRDFVAAAEAIGLPRRRILFREVLPNVSTPLLVELGLRMTYGIAIIAGLSFIGAGLQPPSTDWGLMINENRSALSVQPWPVLAPAIMIALFAIGTTLVTEGLARTIARVDRETAS